MNTLDRILDHKIVAIIRGADQRDVINIAKSLYEGGIRILEITMNSVNPLQVIEDVSCEFGDRMVIGVGRCLTLKQLNPLFQQARNLFFPLL